MSRRPIKPRGVDSFNTGNNAGEGWHRGFHACAQNCAVPGCGVGVTKGRYLCLRHFHMLSPGLKYKVSANYKPWAWGGKPPGEWVGIARKVTQFILNKEDDPGGEIVWNKN